MHIKITLLCLLAFSMVACSSNTASNNASLANKDRQLASQGLANERALNQKAAANLRVANVLNELDGTIGDDVRAKIAAAGLRFPVDELSLIAIKDTRVIEVWGRNLGERQWKMITSYPFTGYSGKLGPKLREGDRQIPEGIYKVPHLNPDSSFHLSIGVDYPNVQDVLQAQRDGRTQLGGDIFIHGDDKTIGCVPIGDTNIESLFYMVGMTGERNINVIISPYDFRHKAIKNPTNLAWVPSLYVDIQRAMLAYQ